VGTRKIVFFGNCQALALQRFCRRFLAPRTGDVMTVIDIAAYDVAKARVELGNADLTEEAELRRVLASLLDRSGRFEEAAADGRAR
jgi:hypothetical protein